MAESKTIKRYYKPRARYIAVDLWQTNFGETSVDAVMYLYAKKFNINQRNIKKYNFSHCLNTLRKIEDPEYTPPNYGTN